MPDLDLTSLTLVQVIGLTALITFLDFIGSVLFAAAKGKFDLAYIAVWLQSHVPTRIFPILGLALVGQGVPALNIPAIPFAFGLALTGLTAYALETVASLRDSMTGASNVPSNVTPEPEA